jgi:hypothetical protein
MAKWQQSSSLPENLIDSATLNHNVGCVVVKESEL